MTKRSTAILQLAMTGILWSIGGLLIKLLDLHPFVISSLRSMIASFVILIFLKFRPRFTFSKAQITGALCYVVTVSLFVTANKLTSSANAILLQYGAPIYAAFMGYFILREGLRWFDFIAIAGIAVGMAVFFSDSISGGNMLGNILAIISGVTFAGQAVCLRLQKGGSQVETYLLGNMLAALIGIPFFAVSMPAIHHLWPVLGLGIFQLGIPYILYPLASKNVTALDLILIPTIEPILNPLWVFIGTGEKPSGHSIAGGIIVVLVVVFKSVCTFKYNKTPQI